MVKFILIFLSSILISHSLSSENILFSQYGKIRQPIKNFEAKHIIKYANITQRVDHFNPSDTRTFELLYAINEAHFKPNGPIFVQAPFFENYLMEGHMYDMGREFGAYMILPEFRFYYDTPNGPGNSSVANFEYNTFEQKIADIVHLIKTLKSEERFSQSKVIFFGCAELAGNIATWIRLEYSDVVDGAVASSAPVNLKAGSPEFYEHLSNEIINQEGQGCRDIINAGFREIMQLIAHNKSEEFAKLFNLCTPQSFLFEDIIMFLKRRVMIEFIVDSYNACPLLNILPGSPIEKICGYVKFMHGGSCILPVEFDEFISRYQEDGRSFIYTECKETGAIPTSVSPDMLFADSIPLSFVTDYYCPRIFDSSLFGENMVRSIERANEKYGGLTPNVTKVVHVHGSRDVYSLLGITKDLNPESPAIVIEGEPECADIEQSFPTGRPELKAARQRIRELVKKWIQ